MQLTDISLALKSGRSDVVPKLRSLLQENKNLKNQISDLQKQLAMKSENTSEIKSKVQSVNGIKFLGQTISGVANKELRNILDSYKEELGSGIILLLSTSEDKVSIIAGVTEDLTDRISAVDVVKLASEETGGNGGGGRRDMAQAGGEKPDKASQAISSVIRLIEKIRL